MLDVGLKDAYVDMLCRLVRIPSRSSPDGGEEGEVQALVAEEFRRTGFPVSTFEAEDVPEFFDHPVCYGPGRDYKGRATVICEVGNPDAPALLIAAHSDTVQISLPEQWTVDPFCGQVRDGNVVGLGSGDDKWGVAAMLTIARALAGHDTQAGRRIVFASTVDEENGVGNGLLLLALSGIKAEAGIYLDGLYGDVVIGNLGGSGLDLAPGDAVTAEMLERHALALDEECKKLSRERESLYDRDHYRDNHSRTWSVRLDRINDSRGRFQAAFYMLPGEDKATLERGIRDAVARALGDDLALYTLTCEEPWFEPSFIGADPPVVRNLAASFLDVTGASARVSTISKQDVFVLNNHAGIPTTSFGAARAEGPGAFHQPDENVSIEAAWQCCDAVYRTILSWLDGEASWQRDPASGSC